MLTLLAGSLASPLVKVEQFGMAQCPWTSTLTTTFYNECLVNGNVAPLINYTLNMVGGKKGGANYTPGQDSFHGGQEITAERYQLCARELEPGFGVPAWRWVNFTSCMNGFKGIAICTEYSDAKITSTAQKCAAKVGFDWAELESCANSTVGEALYEASATFTSDEIAAGRVLKYGTFGKDFGIPLIRIAGKVYAGLATFEKLGEKICTAAGSAAPADCGCGKK